MLVLVMRCPRWGVVIISAGQRNYPWRGEPCGLECWTVKPISPPALPPHPRASPLFDQVNCAQCSVNNSLCPPEKLEGQEFDD